MGSQLNLTRGYECALPQARVVESVPTNYGSNYPLIAVLSLAGVQAPWLLEGALDSESFQGYVAEVLANVLEPGDMFVCDNLATRKIAWVA